MFLNIITKSGHTIKESVMYSLLHTVLCTHTVIINCYVHAVRCHIQNQDSMLVNRNAMMSTENLLLVTLTKF